MKKKILIIRSVSFQQLDKNLAAIAKQFPVGGGQWELHLLTHSHGIPQARSYKAISQLIDYGSRGNFSFFHLPRCFKKSKSAPGDRGASGADNKEEKGYEAIVVPVTNKSGAGFLNVLFMSLRIPTRSIYMCNLLSEIWKVSRKRIVFLALKSCFFSLFAAVMILPLLILFLSVFLVFQVIGRPGKRRARHGVPLP